MIQARYLIQRYIFITTGSVPDVLGAMITDVAVFEEMITTASAFFIRLHFATDEEE